MVFNPGLSNNPLATSRTLTVGGKSLVYRGASVLFPAVVREGWVEIWSLQGSDVIALRGTTQTISGEMRSVSSPSTVWPGFLSGNSVSYNNVQSVSSFYGSTDQASAIITSPAIPSRLCDMVTTAVGGSAYYGWTGTLRYPIAVQNPIAGCLMQDTIGNGSNVVLKISRSTYGASATAALNLLGSFDPDPPVIFTSQIDEVVRGRPFSQTIAFTPTSPTVVWSVVDGLLPIGLSLDSVTGTISGTPTQFGGTYSFTLQASNEWGSDQHEFSGDILSYSMPFVSDNTTKLKQRQLGLYYPVSQQVKVSGTFRPVVSKN